MDFFTKEHDFFSIKEIESLGSKYVGIHPMQMKDLLQSLIDDSLVNNEKCGISMVYWCFKHDKLKKLMNLETIKKDKVKELELKKQVIIKQLKDGKDNRKSLENTLSKMKQIEQLKSQSTDLKSQIDSKNFNIKDIKADLKSQINLGEVCTDNIEALIHHFKQQGIPRDLFTKEIGIPDEFTDYPLINF